VNDPLPKTTAAAPGWLPADTAPHGAPIAVRESAKSDPVTAIRDQHVGWWDENRQHVLPFTPVEWQAPG
jgi:hypothetical protein